METCLKNERYLGWFLKIVERNKSKKGAKVIPPRVGYLFLLALSCIFGYFQSMPINETVDNLKELFKKIKMMELWERIFPLLNLSNLRSLELLQINPYSSHLHSSCK